jgi:hypothetical protein
MMANRIITNEIGNSVEVAAWRTEDNGVCFTLCGPSSRSENAVTMAEAAALRDLLGVALNMSNVGDHQELDATDGAHPAWWRGYDYGSTQWRLMAEQTLIDAAAIMDGWATDVQAWTKWDQTVRDRVSSLLKALAGVRAEKELAANGEFLKHRKTSP